MQLQRLCACILVTYILYDVKSAQAGTPLSSKVVWSVNAGGDRHVDIHGVRYEKDTLSVGEASDYGKILQIGRVPVPDQILYQTERFNFDDFSYNVPLKGDGDYVLVLKFSEVWFSGPNQKIFNVNLDGTTVVENLDIFAKVGRGVAHDEIIPFKVQKNQLIVNGQKSAIDGKRLMLTLVKGTHDNPKLNAAYVLKGTVSDVPVLPPLAEEEEQEEEEEAAAASQQTQQDNIKRKHASGPKVPDPYSMSDTSTYMIPIAIAVGAFVPLLYCLCKI